MYAACATAVSRGWLNVVADRNTKRAAERTIVSNATSNPITGRTIDYLAIRDVDELGEPVTFIAVAPNAVYQVPKEGVLCMKHARVWKTLRLF